MTRLRVGRHEWQEFAKNQLRLQGAEMIGPKLICINLQPYTTAQAPERSDILNVGGFNDAVFSVVAAFLGDDVGRFVAEEEAVEDEWNTRANDHTTP